MICVLLGHNWGVSTSRMHVLVSIGENDRYDEKQDGVEERWVPWSYCLRCGVVRQIETNSPARADFRFDPKTK